jgi:hypothetical protein
MLLRFYADSGYELSIGSEILAKFSPSLKNKQHWSESEGVMLSFKSNSDSLIKL